MTRLISGSVTGAVTLAAPDNPLVVTPTGAIVSTGAGVDGVDGAAGTDWRIAIRGTVSSAGGWGIELAGAGVLRNRGSLTGDLGAFDTRGFGRVVNSGAISATGFGATAIVLAAGGRVANAAGGSISAANGTAVDISGDAGRVANDGTISGRTGVLLEAGGSVTNEAHGLIAGDGRTTAVDIAGGRGVVTNRGEIDGGYGNGVVLEAGGSVANLAGGSILAGFRGVAVSLGGSGTVTNSGTIEGARSGGVRLSEGGRVVNTKSGSISAGLRAAGVAIDGAAGVLVNDGAITGSGAGVQISAGGDVTNAGTIAGAGSGLGIRSAGVDIDEGSVVNRASGVISGVAYGVTTGAGPVAITNAGMISGGVASVLFGAGSANDLLVIAPGAVFDGAVDATAATDATIELLRGTGDIAGIGNDAFHGFGTLQADRGADWTLNGVNTVGTALNDGELEVSGALTVGVVDPASDGTFSLDRKATLEIGQALGGESTIDFRPGGELVVDDAALFGGHVGIRRYAGPLLEDFGGSTVDLRGFSVAGLHDAFSADTGLLQLSNAASQVATLAFETSGLGPGTFHFASDGTGGVLVTHA